MYSKRRVTIMFCCRPFFLTAMCVFALSRQVELMPITLMCSLCVFALAGTDCRLRGTIIAANPVHGPLICFSRGHSIPAPPSLSLFLSHLPLFFLFTTPQQDSPLSPYLVLLKVISLFFPPFPPSSPLAFSL